MNRESIIRISQLFGIILLTIIFGTSLYSVAQVIRNRQSNINPTSSEPNNTMVVDSEVDEPDIIIHFAFIDSNKSFRSTIDDSSWDSKQITSIALLQEYELQARTLIQKMNIPSTVPLNVFATLDEITTDIQNTTHIGLIPLINSAPQFKTLNYNSIDPFEVDTFEQYPLSVVIASSDPIADSFRSIIEYQPSKITKIGHTGSVIPARWVEKYTTLIHAGDYSPWFTTTTPLFDSQDVTSSTWEAPMLGRGVPCNQCMSFVASEDFNDAIKDSGIDVFSLASNHIMDGGNDGLNKTKELLESNGQIHLGASDANNYDALEPILVETDNIRIAYITFNDTPGFEQWAQETTGGAANISDWVIQNGVTTSYSLNRNRLRETIKRAEALEPDIIVAIAHWSMVEYQARPTPYVRELKAALVEEGVDIIFGDHTHWVGEIELAQKTASIDNTQKISSSIVPVFYSVGNYIFDQEWSVETEQGMTAEVIMYEDRIIGIRFYPHQLRLKDRATVELLPTGSAEYIQTMKRVFDSSPLL